VLSQATERASISDGGLFDAVVADVDREQAKQLAQVATSIDHHRAWAGDVRRAQRAAVTALRAEARDLLAQAVRPQAVFTGTFYVAEPVSQQTATLIAAADRLVAASSRRHHVRIAQPPPVRLTAAAEPLAQLARVTTTPLPVRLAVAHDGDLDIWNLEDGSVRRNVADVRIDDGFPVRRVGTALLTMSNSHWVLLPADGGRHMSLPGAADYLAAGSDGLWQVDGSVIHRLGPDAHQIGRSYTLPGGFDPPFAATADALVIARTSPDAGTFPFLWTPLTGSLRALPGECNAGVFAAADRVVYVPCDPVQRLVALDPRTGTVRPLRSPPGLQVVDGTELLAPDGRRVAAMVQPPGADYEDPASTKLAVWDLDTGRVELIGAAASAVAWSADSSVLLVNPRFDGGSTTNLPLAYWTPGASALAPIRIPATDVSDTVALLPAA